MNEKEQMQNEAPDFEVIDVDGCMSSMGPKPQG